MTISAAVQSDIDAIGRIPVVDTALQILRRTTGLRMALVARVTDDEWAACAVLDDAEWGLRVGLELEVATTYCATVCRADAPLFITHASEDPVYRNHPALHHYNIESYIAVPLHRRNGDQFGVLCALDPNPSELPPAHVDTLRLLASLISYELEADEAQRTLEQELISARELARAREKLIGILSHDLRTPLTAIVIGSQELASGANLTTEQQRTAIGIVGSARRATRMVADLLDFTRARLGRGIPVDPGPADLSAIVTKVVSEIRHAYPGREMKIAIDGECRGTWDADRAAQVTSNLVTNALQHGVEGPVTIRVRGAADGVTIEVENAARAIEPEKAANLFSPFRSSTSGHGLGLGLFIVEQILTAHRGSVEMLQSNGRVTFRTRWPR